MHILIFLFGEKKIREIKGSLRFEIFENLDLKFAKLQN